MESFCHEEYWDTCQSQLQDGGRRNSTYLDDHGPPPRKVLPFPSQVVYNRVGKCGSRTVVLLLRILSERHGFNLVTSDIHNKTRLTKNEQMELIKNISTAEQPYLFTRHVHFLNFSSTPNISKYEDPEQIPTVDLSG
ncbi:Uronyl 2-sulfotransferase [Varanus komodoensis]|nr:Uronyl 2-sulfotransferase [Varanus komodoensis]